jgi:FtsH-binding integral membrane protein
MTTLGSVLFSSIFSLIGFGVLTFFLRTPVMNALYSSFAAIVFSGFIVYDTQLIVGGKHRSERYQLDSRDYVEGR